jgi:large repetitive protein
MHSLLINISNVNEAPSAISLSNTVLDENTPANSNIGSFSSTDPDDGDSFSYSIVGGPDAGAFTINGDGLLLTNSPDFEAQPSYTVRIRTTDVGGLFFEEDFTVIINNLNDISVNLSLSTNSASEAATTSITVTATSSVPVVGDQTVTISISGSAVPADFAGIIPSQITILDGATTGTLILLVNDDSLVEGNETATISINNPSMGIVLGNTTSDNIVIADNDSAGFTVGPTTVSVSEPNNTDGFSVVLTGQPSSNVVLSITSNDPGEATVTPSFLTFSSANWNTPQSVTVTAADDLIADGSQGSNIIVSVVDASSNDVFDALPDQIVAATTLDNDTAGFILNKTTASVNESGSTDSFTVVLTAQPLTNVVLNIGASDTTEATVAPVALTFTPGNWSVPQTVTITGVDDALDDGNMASTITVSVNDASSDNSFDPLADQTLAITTVDNDTAGFTLSKTTASVNESGSTDTFTVILTTQPLTSVVFTITANDSTEATVAPATLTFTTGNWNVPQTVTITGVDDALDDGNIVSTITISVNDASSDNSFDPLADQTVAVTTIDNDTSGFTISKTTASVNESGSTDTFTVILTTQPASSVVLNITASDSTEATVAPATLTFTTGNWNTPQTVTITGVDDALDDGNIVSTITVSVNDASSDNSFDPLADQTLAITTVDNDTAGFTLSKTTASVNESGSNDTFTVILTTQPASSVVLNITANDSTEATVAPTTLTFTTGNWNVPQTVTITGVDDALDDGNIVSTITISVNDASSDNSFDPLADQTVAVTTVDNDTAGFTLSKTTASVNESGSTDTFTVILTTQPASSVVLNITANDSTEATVAPGTLTFTTGNWNTPQTITITGIDDALDDGNIVSTITISVNDASSDNSFDPLSDQTVAVTTIDNDTAGFTLSKTTASVNESGTTDTFTVILTAQPTSNVVFNVTASDNTEATIAPATLTFTTGNWSVAQTVTITGIDDAVDDGNIASTITVSIDDANSDNSFDPLPDQTVAVTTIDNDTAGFTLSKTTASVNESGSTDTFAVSLTVQPISNVVFNVTASDSTEATVAPTTLTFTNANWNVPQIVTITGIDDAVDDGNIASTITVSIDDANSDNSFDPLPDQTVAVTTIDNDNAGFTLSKTTASVNESGSTDTFAVSLTVQPISNVVFNVMANDSTEATVAPATLTFTTGNWNVPQTVTITGIDDAVDDGNIASTITVSVDAANSDNAFDLLPNQTVAITTIDNDTAGFTLSKTTASVNESGSTDTFTVILTTQPASSVVLNITANDSTEATVAPATLTFTTGNWNTPQTITITGIDDALDDGNIVSTITISVNDASSDDAFDPLTDQTLAITTIDNDTAGFTLSKTTASVNESGSNDTFTVILTAQPLTNVVFNITRSDSTEATVAPATLTFTAGNWNTPQTITITGVNDLVVDGNIASTVTVSVNDASSDNSFDPLPDQTVAVTTIDNDTAGFTLSKTTASVNESVTNDTFTVTLTAQPISSVVFDITASDSTEATVTPTTLNFTNGNWNTPQTITITGVNDVLIDGNIASTVTVSVNDASSDNSFDPLSDQTVAVTTIDNDTAGFTLSKTTASVNESGTTDIFTVVLTAQPLTNVVFNITRSDSTEANVAPATLTFTNANWNVAQNVTITGVNDVLVDGSIASTVTVSINAASSDNAFDLLANQTVAVTTIDNDSPTVNLSVSSSIGTEAAATTITVTATAATAVVGNQIVNLAVTGTGITGGDYTLSSATITIFNGMTTGFVTFTVVNDILIEGAETAILTISMPSSGIVLGGTVSRNIAITDNDFPAVNLSVSSNTGTEAAATVVTVTATATSAVVGNQTVNLAVTGTGITAGDYTLSNTTITILSGMTTGTVTFTIVDDASIEVLETATLTISSPSAGVVLGGAISQNVAITDNDFPTWQSISAGSNYTCAIAATGSNAGQAYCWGSDSFGQLGNGAITGDQPTPSPVSTTTGVNTWQSISAGSNHACAIAATGSNAGQAYCWGSDGFGQLGNGAAGNSNVPSPVTSP